MKKKKLKNIISFMMKKDRREKMLMEHKIGDIWKTHKGRNGKEVKATYYLVQMPKGIMKFASLKNAKLWSEQAIISVKGNK